MTDNTFEIIGYFKEYYQNGKFIGTLPCPEPTNEVFGYYSQELVTMEADRITDQNRKLRAGKCYKTYTFPLCGKMIKK